MQVQISEQCLPVKTELGVSIVFCINDLSQVHYVQGVPIKNNPLGNMHHLCNCNRMVTKFTGYHLNWNARWPAILKQIIHQA